MLVDSGSSHSFISESVASCLKGAEPLPVAVNVKAANGQTLQCSYQFPAALWSVHGYTFCSDLKILPLAAYDMIVGMDWLEAHSPMKVHWKQKWMSIPYNGSTAFL